MMKIESAWHAVVRARLSPEQRADLNPGCSPAALDALRKRLPEPIPEPLSALYQLNDGQGGKADGVFSGRCRWDQGLKRTVWLPHENESGPCRFLPLARLCEFYDELRADDDLDVFSPSLIPFAYDGGWVVYAADAASGAIVLLWTGGPDFTLPRDWQTLRHHVAGDFGAFLEKVFGPLAGPLNASEP